MGSSFGTCSKRENRCVKKGMYVCVWSSKERCRKKEKKNLGVLKNKIYANSQEKCFPKVRRDESNHRKTDNSDEVFDDSK